jgi:integral membrane sensor domain MASE1
MPFDIRPVLRYTVVTVLSAVVYVAAAWLGLRYVTLGHSVSVVWPPSGIALAMLVLLGSRYWPGVAIGAFAANLATGSTGGRAR